MGEVELLQNEHQIIICSVFYFYGDAANEELSVQIAKDISDYWNEPEASVIIKRITYRVLFEIKGVYAKTLIPETIFENTDPKNNYFRIEEFSTGNISFVDGIGSNTGYFKLDNLLNNSTTAAHEYGHTIGLKHPEILDILGKGVPGIMHPRGTITDAVYQYDPNAIPLQPGGTMNPFKRKVLQSDIDNLRLHKLDFNKNGFAMLGGFSSIWHEKH